MASVGVSEEMVLCCCVRKQIRAQRKLIDLMVKASCFNGFLWIGEILCWNLHVLDYFHRHSLTN